MSVVFKNQKGIYTNGALRLDEHGVEFVRKYVYDKAVGEEIITSDWKRRFVDPPSQHVGL